MQMVSRHLAGFAENVYGIRSPNRLTRFVRSCSSRMETWKQTVAAAKAIKDTSMEALGSLISSAPGFKQPNAVSAGGGKFKFDLGGF